MSSLRAALAARHLPTLDGLRAVAVLTVVVYHFGVDAVPGDLGVSMFFVLSGFLITWLLVKERRETANISLRRFYTRRVLRIFPAYYVFIAVSFAIDALRRAHWPLGLGVSALLYLVNYYNALHGHPSTSIAHAWSLGIEEQFYLLWPALLSVTLARGTRRVGVLLALLIVAVVAWRSLLYLGLRTGAAYVYNAFDTRFDNLAVGCLLAVWVEAPRFQRVAALLGKSAVAPILTLALLLLSRTRLGAAYHYSLGFTVDAILMAIFLVQLLQVYQSRLWCWLESPVLRHLGLLSYSLYLWHGWGLTIGRHVRFAGVGGQFAAGLIVSFALASGSYYLVERPFLALKEHFEPPSGLATSSLRADLRPR